MKIFKKLIWFWFGIGVIALFFIIFMPPYKDINSESTEKVESVENTETAKTVEKKGRISINTYGEVSTTEQLWEDFGNPSFKLEI